MVTDSPTSVLMVRDLFDLLEDVENSPGENGSSVRLTYSTNGTLNLEGCTAADDLTLCGTEEEAADA